MEKTLLLRILFSPRVTPDNQEELGLSKQYTVNRASAAILLNMQKLGRIGTVSDLKKKKKEEENIPMGPVHISTKPRIMLDLVQGWGFTMRCF